MNGRRDRETERTRTGIESRMDGPSQKRMGRRKEERDGRTE